MNFVDFVFYFYTFVGLYMISLMVLVYLRNRKKMFSYPEGKPEPVSVIIPCFNDEKSIGNTIDSVLNLDYPKDMIEIIVVDDCSQDGSAKVVEKYEKKYSNVKLIKLDKNSGGAAKPTNVGIRAAKYDYVLVTDSDSSPTRDSLKKMIGQLQHDKKVGGVTCSVLVKDPKNFSQKIQYIEYIVIAFARKLLDFVDAVYVTPGPFALYRKDVLFEIGLFDEKNLTQDIEIVWRMMSYGYKARMILPAKVYVDSPDKFKGWWKQRVRWNIGGTQTLWKYKKWALKENMLGMFVIPFFSVSMFLGVFGLGLLLYLMSRRFLVATLSTSYSLASNAAILSANDLTLNISVLNFFGFVLFFVGLIYNLFGIWTMKEVALKKLNFFNFIFFLTIYLMIYPAVMIAAIWRMARGNYSWGRQING